MLARQCHFNILRIRYLFPSFDIHFANLDSFVDVYRIGLTVLGFLFPEVQTREMYILEIVRRISRFTLACVCVQTVRAKAARGILSKHLAEILTRAPTLYTYTGNPLRHFCVARKIAMAYTQFSPKTNPFLV